MTGAVRNIYICVDATFVQCVIDSAADRGGSNVMARFFVVKINLSLLVLSLNNLLFSIYDIKVYAEHFCVLLLKKRKYYERLGPSGGFNQVVLITISIPVLLILILYSIIMNSI